MSNAVALNDIADKKLKEIVLNRRNNGERVTKVSVVAELINKTHKREIKND